MITIKTLLQFIIIYLLSFTTLTVNATEAVIVDLDFLKPFPQSHVVEHKQQENIEYLLATGAMLKVNNVIKPESSQRLSGHLTRITYRVSKGYSSREIFDHFRQQFDPLTADILYECQGRICGPSSLWATNIFSEAKLYGEDREQNYQIISFNHDRNQYYFALYTIKRTNQRVYAHLDILRYPLVSNQKIPDWGSDLQQGIVINVSHDVDNNSSVINLAEWLKNHPQTVIHLVGHSRDSETVSVLLDKSKDLAEELQQTLINLGVPDQQIKIHGVGPLAPDPNHDFLSWVNIIVVD